jgi:mono/diheme cytochrome c family protein
MKRIVILTLLAAVALTTAYLILTIYDKNMKFGRMWETPAVRPHEEKLLVMESGVVPFYGGELIYKRAEGEDLISPFQKTNPEIIESGKALYFNYCAQCHGKYFDGNGTVGQSFHPLPTDLRSKKVQSQSEGVLFKSISYGVPDGRQPPLATTIRIQDRWKIIAFLKSLPPHN